MNPNNFRLQPMQKTASDILGLEYKEIKPKLKLKNIEKENIVSIAIHSTAQSKYWNNSNGWQEVVDYLKSKGYKVILISKEEDGYMNNFHPNGIEKIKNGPLDNVIDILQRSKLFIGVGSGLSWLSWSVGVKTCIISGFSYDYTEPIGNDIIRVKSPENFCSGCFNRHKLDPSDWNWCPDYKGTERQFECSKMITSNMVIEKIKEII
jgi:autotransporter strand-loop-strand O-heptosyltransferase